MIDEVETPAVPEEETTDGTTAEPPADE